jgi:hypothetical protein
LAVAELGPVTAVVVPVAVTGTATRPPFVTTLNWVFPLYEEVTVYEVAAENPVVYVQDVAGSEMVQSVEPPCATVIVPVVGCVGAVEAGVVNPMEKTTGTFTVMLAFGDCGAADRVYTGVSRATGTLIALAVEPLKFESPL